MTVDPIVEEIISALHKGPHAHRPIVRTLVVQNPDRAAIDIALALEAAAAAITTVFEREGLPPHQANLALRLAALVRMDLDVLAARGASDPLCSDLMGYWASENDFFLRL